MRRIRYFSLAALAAAMLLAPAVLAQVTDYKSAIGFTLLAAEQRGKLPDGRTVAVSQVEAGDGYCPTTTSSFFEGKAFAFRGVDRAPSDHANSVAEIFYGKAGSLAPGVASIELWPSDIFLGPRMLDAGGAGQPAVVKAQVQNHSWIDSLGGAKEDEDALRRFDFMVDRDNVVAVLGVNNGRHNKMPAIMASCYNGIAVGVSKGEHSIGGTRVDGKGRLKPEIVAPMKETSLAAPLVASAAVLLLDAVHQDPALEGAEQSQAIKAILLAGATKEQIPGWKRSPEQPIDSHYGAGELNIYNSYHILKGGRQPPGAGQPVALKGWDVRIPEEGRQLYFFRVAKEPGLREFSAVLTWNRMVVNGIPGVMEWGDPQSILVNLALRLFKADGSKAGELVDSSESTIDNLQHIYRRPLPAGEYVLEVTADLRTVPYAIAWRGEE